MALRVFVATAPRAGATLTLPAAAARHVQVRRLQPGADLVLFDGSGSDWPARVVAMRRDGIQVEVGSPEPGIGALVPEAMLALGMPANERMDWLVEKATELGVARLQPLQCERSVLRLDADRAARRRLHWVSVAAAACEQCGRSQLPEIEPVRSFDDWLAAPSAVERRWLLAPGAPRPRRADFGRAWCALSGPEGGLTPAEQAAARDAGFQPIGLGERILRAETAPLALLAWAALG